MGAQISTNLSSCCSSNIKSKADLGLYINSANKSTLMVINFTTTWCRPCIDAEPPMRKLAEEFPDVKFARVDIDLLQDVVKEFDLKKMPTVLLCKKVDDGLDKGKGAAEVGGGNGGGNRISSANNVEGNSVVPSPKRRTVNYAGMVVLIDEIDRMEGPLEDHELRKKIEYYKNQPTTASFKSSFKSTDEFYSYLEKSKPTQLMVINFTTEWYGPCKKAQDPFKKLANDFKDVKFAKVDVDVLMKIVEELDVEKMPTFLLVKVKKLEKEHVKKDGVQEDHKQKKEPPEHVKKDGVQGDHKEKKEPPEKEHVQKDGVQGDHKEKKEPPEKEHVKKDGVQGDRKGIKKTPVLNKRYKMVTLAQVVGWDNNKDRELRKMIREHRYTTT